MSSANDAANVTNPTKKVIKLHNLDRTSSSTTNAAASPPPSTPPSTAEPLQHLSTSLLEPIEYTRVQMQELNAAQRTFEGAYIRTAISKFSFGIVILRIFEKQFLPIGILYEVSALITLGIAVISRLKREGQLKLHPSTTFQTGGGYVALSAALDIATMVVLLVFIAKID